jgi:LmbE family N-acetylglucosaminyl deacetylase
LTNLRTDEWTYRPLLPDAESVIAPDTMTMPALQDLAPLLIISPHLDDAVFSCGELCAALPHTTVLTVFAGTPEHPERLTDWDRHCGFETAGQAMEKRRREDETALQRLAALPHWLPFLDAQYTDPAAPETAAGIADAVLAFVTRFRPAAVMMPLGLFHSDHVLVHEACLRMRQCFASPLWLGYEEALYRRMPALVQRRLATLDAGGVVATPLFPDLPDADESGRRRAVKRQAIGAYTSQLRAFGDEGYTDTFAPEHYWRLTD